MSLQCLEINLKPTPSNKLKWITIALRKDDYKLDSERIRNVPLLRKDQSDLDENKSIYQMMAKLNCLDDKVHHNQWCVISQARSQTHRILDLQDELEECDNEFVINCTFPFQHSVRSRKERIY